MDSTHLVARLAGGLLNLNALRSHWGSVASSLKAPYLIVWSVALTSKSASHVASGRGSTRSGATHGSVEPLAGAFRGGGCA
jgi:hypothetical protein